ncbi:MAG: iron-sulfur cluster assembly accessory protein [Deltaproteobacteria bacterium]|nr:iron-sulfur cluster assembly accessory protein [Deltaproteobacteria bacterium]
MDQEQQRRELGQTEEPLLTFTAKAIEIMKQTMLQAGMSSGGVRLTVAGGGCEGYQYSLTMTDAARAHDAVIVQDGVKAFLDPFSARHLQGTQLDYVSNRHGTGFHFFGIESMKTIGCASSLLLRRCMAGNTRTKGCTESAKRPLMTLVREAAPPEMLAKTSLSHPGMRPRTICPQCHYVVCRCEQAA